jgi:predicted MFS family arabinose efflux permease
LVALSVLGLGEIVGSPFYGKILDRFGHRTMIISCMIGIVIAVFAIISYIVVFKFNMWAAIAVCFLWGF